MFRNEIIETGKQVIHLEAKALFALEELIDSSFTQAVTLIQSLEGKGKLIISGMGKAGLIGAKIAATFSSLGTASFFMHPAEASHGDLGMVSETDVLLLLSNSGASEEVIHLIPSFKKLGVSIIAITSKPKSILAKNADVTLNLGDFQEACLMKLAPTTSTTLMLALGDALAVATMKIKKGFDEKAYAFFHPGGLLGKKLLKVEEVMRKGDDVVKCSETTEVKSVLFAMTKTRSGMALILAKDGSLEGVFTDGDLRRALEKNENILKQEVRIWMTANPQSIEAGHFVTKAVKILGDEQIGDLPVVNHQNKPLGIISAKDLLSLGLI